MGARGPKPGSGEVSAWVLQVVKPGGATKAEMLLGSVFTYKQVDNAVQRLKAIGILEFDVRGGPGRRGIARRYRLTEGEKQIADSIIYPAGRRTRRARVVAESTSVRGIENAFRAIVAERTAPAG